MIHLIRKQCVAPFMVALCLLPIMMFVPALSTSSPNGYKLSQTSKSLGTQDVYISPLGIKVINPKMGKGMVCCPPDWKVINWSTRTNSYAVEEFKKWKPLLVMGEQVFNGYDIREIPFGSAISAKVAGHPTKQYKSMSSFARLMLYRYSHRKAPGVAPMLVTMDYTEEPPMPAQIGELMERQYQAPHIKGVPLRMVFVNCNGDTAIELTTNSFTPIHLTPADYAFPKNLRKVQTDQQLNEAPNSEEIRDLMDL